MVWTWLNDHVLAAARLPSLGSSSHVEEPETSAAGPVRDESPKDDVPVTDTPLEEEEVEIAVTPGASAEESVLIDSAPINVEHVAEEGEGEVAECPFCVLMRKGGCEPEFKAFMECGSRAESGEAQYTDCVEFFDALHNCMQRNSEVFDQLLGSMDPPVPGRDTEGGDEQEGGDKDVVVEVVEEVVVKGQPEAEADLVRDGVDTEAAGGAGQEEEPAGSSQTLVKAEEGEVAGGQTSGTDKSEEETASAQSAEPSSYLESLSEGVLAVVAGSHPDVGRAVHEVVEKVTGTLEEGAAAVEEVLEGRGKGESKEAGPHPQGDAFLHVVEDRVTALAEEVVEAGEHLVEVVGEKVAEAAHYVAEHTTGDLSSVAEGVAEAAEVVAKVAVEALHRHEHHDGEKREAVESKAQEVKEGGESKEI